MASGSRRYYGAAPKSDLPQSAAGTGSVLLGVGALSDESLLAGLAAGDPEAATAFVRQFQARVYGLALTIVRDAQVAEDVAQETFVRAWRNAAAYDPRRGRVAGWLLTIARNLAIDAARLRVPEPAEPELLEAALLSASDQGAPLDADPVDRGHVRTALAELPAGQRRALVLAACMGCTAREVGELEEIPLGTAKTRIRSAVRRLRSTLEAGHEV